MHQLIATHVPQLTGQAALASFLVLKAGSFLVQTQVISKAKLREDTLEYTGPKLNDNLGSFMAPSSSPVLRWTSWSPQYYPGEDVVRGLVHLCFIPSNDVDLLPRQSSTQS